jgi:hypothetical protein
MTITSKYRGHCTACNAQILPGDQVNWVKGVKGVTCAACPMPTNGTPVAAPVASASGQVANRLAELTAAAAADRRTAAIKIGELEAALVTARDHFRAQRDEIAALKARLAFEAMPVISGWPTDAEIAVMEAARLATETPSTKERQAIPVITDDDCPI